MREILGRRRRLRLRRKEGTARLDAALTCATVWQWPVLPGVGTAQAGPRGESGGPGCACPEPDCAVPGAHPFDPGLLAATTDERMVRWWWTHRPAAPVMLATGGRAPCAVSLPAVAGARALSALDARGMRLGPVVATPTRWSLLVAPYTLERLGELLYAKDWVPSSLRFHGEGAISSCRRPGPARARSAGSGPPRSSGPPTPPRSPAGGRRAGLPRSPRPGSRMSKRSWTPWSRRAPAPRAAAAGWPTDRRTLTCPRESRRPGGVRLAVSARGARLTAPGSPGPAHSNGCEPGRIPGKRVPREPAAPVAPISSPRRQEFRVVARWGHHECPRDRPGSWLPPCSPAWFRWSLPRIPSLLRMSYRVIRSRRNRLADRQKARGQRHLMTCPEKASPPFP